jgi:adenylyltransferase/sulfurtransferase
MPDFDDVDASNLHRQVLYGTSDVGRPKVEAAKARLQDLNPDIVIETHDAALTSENALGIIEKYDVIVDGTDNFATRYLVNDACVLLGKPNVYGSIFRFEGQASVFSAADGPCYRCLYPEPPPPHLVPSCAEGGVLGVLPGVVGTIQATETIKLLTGIGETLVGRLLLFDALRMSLAYTTRAGAFLLLLTEVHPRLLDLPPQPYPAGAPSLPGPQQLSINEAPLPAETAPVGPPAPPAAPEA